MKNNRHRNRFSMVLLGAAVGMGAAWFLRQRSRQPEHLGMKKVLLFAVSQRMLAEQHGPAQAKILMEDVRRKYAQLCGKCPVPSNAAMRKHLYENILPGLALYQTLLAEHDGDKDSTLAEVEEIFRVWTIEKVTPILGPIKALPLPFGLMKKAANLAVMLFPAEGWDITVIEDSSDRLALNITRCFYLNTLTTLGAPELTASFCMTDDVMAEMFPASMRFVRPHTLGRGDTLCDFQYCRANRFMPAVPREILSIHEETM